MLHRHYMHRCIELAKLGTGKVAPNPLVGAVLVYHDRIIGEGWHAQYGGPHAEVNCIASVKKEDRELIPKSTLYVSLEPCVHHGKTPPCTDLIIQHKIPKVIIGCRDPFKEVDARLNDAVGQGKGIEKLKAAGVEVFLLSGEMEKECIELNKRFITFNTLHRPYVIMKWAQTSDHKISSGTKDRLLISNEYSNRLIHKWRSEEASILVATNTALLDDPELTARLWPGSSPVRLILDMNLRLPSNLKIFNGAVRTIIFNSIRQEEKENLLNYKLAKDKNLVQQLLAALYELKIQSVLVEGGAKLLQSFIDEGIWDEARIINNEKLIINNGLHAPLLNCNRKISEQTILSDRIEIFKPEETV
jgi:diaminohydroxyphosphoribosylaminopyrimidine deaminase/5-amino-6-(5-phosphoribosylamino)uracil reductase